ncbi:hypothetical protein JAAARDRAFT_62040 [Jaapia argillacea MUCL 33604]|uniref:Uncharacterized protein n=1 Tax=Jaapia argillacea MUCL 33604 TaxID=933084 RepID=A0A067PBI7_9AGAM|nr:hypothetical protein JAAARDRAFT_62040 [Jaapia argillacea MUCL 33604]
MARGIIALGWPGWVDRLLPGCPVVHSSSSETPASPSNASLFIHPFAPSSMSPFAPALLHCVSLRSRRDTSTAKFQS